MGVLILNPDEIIQLNQNLLYSKVGDEIVLLTVESGKYFKVDSVGSRIWEVIKEPISINSLCKQLMEEYDVSLEQCKEDVMPFLERLQNDNLILIK